MLIISLTHVNSRSQWPHSLRRRSAAARLLRSWVSVPPGHGCLSVLSAVLSGRGLCDELITRLEESYQMWRVVVCDQETSWTRRPWPALDCRATKTTTTTTTQSISLYVNISDLIRIMKLQLLKYTEHSILGKLIVAYINKRYCLLWKWIFNTMFVRTARWH
jgi:hypothetical protein